MLGFPGTCPHCGSGDDLFCNWDGKRPAPCDAEHDEDLEGTDHG